jgi:hypothetical protein
MAITSLRLHQKKPPPVGQRRQGILRSGERSLGSGRMKVACVLIPRNGFKGIDFS